MRYAKTDNFRLFPTVHIAYADVKDRSAWVNFAFVSEFEKHTTLVEGAYPQPAMAMPEYSVEVADQ